MVGSVLRISRSMLELEIIFGLENVYNPRFAESEICLPLFDTELNITGVAIWLPF